MITVDLVHLLDAQDAVNWAQPEEEDEDDFFAPDQYDTRLEKVLLDWSKRTGSDLGEQVGDFAEFIATSEE